MNRQIPHDENAEKCIIGCCITDPVRCLADIQMCITREYFYSVQCQMAFDAICSIQPDKLDIITVCEKMPDYAFFGQCADMVTSTVNYPAWIEILTSKFILRKIISTMNETLGLIAGGEINGESVLEIVEREVMKIRPHRNKFVDMRSLVSLAIDAIESRLTGTSGIMGLPTGLIDLDQKTDGLHRGELVVLAAYPSCGKTALMMNMICHNVELGIPAGVLTAEMRPVQLVVRALCSASRCNLRKIDQGGLARMVEQSRWLSASKLCIEPAEGLSIGQVGASARRMKQKNGIRMIGVDYIQLLSGTGDNREQQIASVSRGLKQIALELDITVIALSQLNDDGRLRESRAIGQDADSVWILENNGDRQPEIQPVNLKITKSRDGETGTVPLTFMKTFTRFESQSPREN